VKLKVNEWVDEEKKIQRMGSNVKESINSNEGGETR
jgi:hypothetical protein